MMNKDLSKEQKDYALFLPAISSFFASFVGKQQSEDYVPASRMPLGISEMEMLNFFNEHKGLFTYKWGLYSAGHAELDLTKNAPRDDMIRNRDKHTFLVADSGGFQIAKGIWEAEWNNPSCPRAEKYRKAVLEWLCNISDYSMSLDIPTWTSNDPEAAKKVGIHSYDDAVNATKYNHEYFMKNAYGDVKFLNVLQGSNHTEADLWYDEMKGYCDPTLHEKPFRGWAMGGANMADPHLAIKRIITLIHEGLLEEGHQDKMHFLGTSKLEWAVLLTLLQRAVRRTHNKNFTISFDCASPFIAAAMGRIYHETVTPDYRNLTNNNKSGKWIYRTNSTVTDKKYFNDTRQFSKGVVTDGIHDIFADSVISDRLTMKDICVLGPGDLDKNGNEGFTSWDSFSYALVGAHNLWHHINSVQEANRQYDNGLMPRSFRIAENEKIVTLQNVIDEIFSTDDFKRRLEILDSHKDLLLQMPGARGMSFKKSLDYETELEKIENTKVAATVKVSDNFSNKVTIFTKTTKATVNTGIFE